ncbi:hypothetical protein CAPTEDRAFT_157486 [Capitella teleta]|uniref:Uncharacterized protein n=1 Tax=Capitella teleta TaxID=283909 RepID=R7TQP3_CAPTE|nr:hypothetical protein CAPTEDRAFT_157486 [Capitella teleta]|eukprot:ELT93340.1 hypothetical protein CAPTEDRAFT_157486 [Capitella teleta]
METKGSLLLRSDHMNYSRAVKNANWHQARESEPKDYNISKDKERNLCKATYNRIGDITTGELPNTTYQDFSRDVYDKAAYTEQEGKKFMITEKTCDQLHLERDTGNPKSGYGSVLPHHNAEYDKCHLETTYLTDFTSKFPGFTPNGEKEGGDEAEEALPDYTLAHKRCLSQFTDQAGHRRAGRNTWADESGVYHNSHYKEQCPVYVPSNPFSAMMNQ